MQALWCWRLQKGEKVGISDITDEFVKLNKSESSEPDAKNVTVYRELQALQDELSSSLRGTFAQHRRFLTTFQRPRRT